jgi:hypothetical protein
MTIPDYVGIGAGRCGTTSLHVALLRHPNVEQLKQKEVHYWDNKYGRKPVRWYFNLFERNKNSITGEITPSYFYAPEVPERIAKHCPNVKLLVLLRNPVDAMWSSFHRLRRRKQTRAPSVLYFLDRDRKFFHQVKKRHYAKHLARWFAVFPREQFWIMQSERIFRTGNTTGLWKFLGVPHKNIHFPWEGKQQYKVKPKVRRELSRFFRPLNEELYDLLGERYDWE